MPKQYNWFDSSALDRSEWEHLCPVNEYRLVGPDQLPSIIPKALAKKFDSVLVVASGSLDGNVAYYMVNGNRVDKKALEIDQMPFGIVFVGTSAVASGSLIQHGDWPGRTIKPPPEFWNSIDASGIGNCYPLSENPNNPSGSISDLKVDSQNYALRNIVTIMKKYVDDASE